ncbi:hypothetical protein OEZ86_007496 [Tetradesmus obliquus]|nr:hypothetical protein OEZ86_007496 [Tetradesmus obliquus]
MPTLQPETHLHRKLQQGWGGGFAGCAGRPLVIAYGGPSPPTNIDDLLDNMESPLTKIDVASNRGASVDGGDDRNVKLAVDTAKVELISLSDPASCIRSLATVRGGLAIIDDGQLPDLSALSRVRSVVGPLYIYGRTNASLTSLAGLENLQQVGGLNLAHTRLQNIAALSKLTVLQGDLVAWDNPALASLAGLQGVTQMYGKLWLENNPMLQDLNGLQGVQVIEGDITLRFLDGLTTLNGLGSLVSTNGELLLHDLPRLASTRGLTSFTSVGVSLVVQQNPMLADLDGFARLTRVPGDLQLYLLPALPDLRAMASLTEVGLNAVVGANAGLTTLKGLDNLRSVGILLSISHNPRLTSLQASTAAHYAKSGRALCLSRWYRCSAAILGLIAQRKVHDCKSNCRALLPLCSYAVLRSHCVP